MPVPLLALLSVENLAAQTEALVKVEVYVDRRGNAAWPGKEKPSEPKRAGGQSEIATQ
jgi:hypothetical protein